MKYIILQIVAACLVFAVAVADPTPLQAEASVHWGYEGERGPAHWGDLAPEFATCATGRAQSPIDLAGNPTRDRAAAPLAFRYQPTPLAVKNNGHTLQVDYAPGSSATINGDRYDLLQFHFHAPSEHTVNGRPAAMELHLVHRNAAGKLAVVGVLIEAGAANPELARLWENAPTEEGTSAPNGSINAANLLPASQGTLYHYTGSLTTPPCSEDVDWNVLAVPIQASPAQIAQFRQLYDGNARPVQALNRRTLESFNSAIPVLW